MSAVYMLALLAAFTVGMAVGGRLIWGLATDVINLERKQRARRQGASDV